LGGERRTTREIEHNLGDVDDDEGAGEPVDPDHIVPTVGAN
jgi:hypothetical protein